MAEAAAAALDVATVANVDTGIEAVAVDDTDDVDTLENCLNFVFNINNSKGSISTFLVIIRNLIDFTNE